MRVLDLFAGLGGWGSAFLERGHEVVSVDFDKRFDVTIHADVFDLKAKTLGAFDIVLASPPCECFSMLTVGKNWHASDGRPKTSRAAKAEALVWATRILIEQLEPAFFVMENPRGMLRTLRPVAGLERRTVTYCQYGAPWMKPTDLWGGFPPSLVLRPMCSPGDDCHIEAPRGSRTSIQGNVLDGRLSTWKDSIRDEVGSSNKHEVAARRALVPTELSLEVCVAAERDLAAGLTWRAGQRITEEHAQGLFAMAAVPTNTTEEEGA